MGFSFRNCIRLSLIDRFVHVSRVRALQHGTNWEGIWEPEVDDWGNESLTQLQLVRWFSLYKSNCCTDKEVQEDFKSRAQIAEFWIRVRYIYFFNLFVY